MGWSSLKLGAGGQLTNIQISPVDGTMVIRADAYGAYRYDPNAVNPGNAGGSGKWVQLFTAASIPSPSIPSPYSLSGVYEIVLAPSNSSRFYMFQGLSIYTTTNKGVTWTLTGFTGVGGAGYADGNDNTKFSAPYMAVDPFDDQRCYTGTPSNGVWFTTNGGTSWTQISTATIPAGGAYPSASMGGGNLIAFDPSSSHPGNVTQTIYATSYGNGVYKTLNGGGSWATISSPPLLNATKALVNGGKLYLIGDGTGNIYEYTGSAWNTYSTGSGNLNGIRAIAFDPNNNNHVVAVDYNGNMATTASGVSTGWSGWNTGGGNGVNLTLVATDIPYLAQALPTQNGMTLTVIAFDAASKLWCPAGVGVWTTTNTTISSSTTPVTYTSVSAGIEELVSQWIVVPPGGTPIVAVWDRPLFAPNLTQYPSVYGPGVNTVFGLVEGWSVDYAQTVPTTVVGLVQNNSTSGNSVWKSVNSGATWTINANNPPGNPGGSVAASTPLNFVTSTQGGGIFYTLDAGATAWGNPTISGASITNTDAGWYTSSRDRKIQNVCADRVTSGTFYAYCNLVSTAPGMYVSTNGGATFTLRAAGSVSSFYFNNTQMRAVPGVAGNFYSASGATDFSNSSPFIEWTWNGTTLTQNTISGVATVWSFGFGKAKPGGSGYPAVYIYGNVSGGGNGVGLYQSDDHCATWTKLSNNFVPAWDGAGSLDQVATVSGDINTYGTVYIGFEGSGFSMYVLDITGPTGTFAFSIIMQGTARITKMVGY